MIYEFDQYSTDVQHELTAMDIDAPTRALLESTPMDEKMEEQVYAQHEYESEEEEESDVQSDFEVIDDDDDDVDIDY